MVLTAGDTFAVFRIDGIAGRGGMGIVYRATHLSLERTVALKLIAPELAQNPGFRERFERESRVLAVIEHPNVIPVFHAGEADERLFIAMRWVEGTDLGRMLGREGALDPRLATSIAEQLASALDAAHAHGLVHRDVKPGNVLLERREDGLHTFLTDFGVTKRLGRGDESTVTGQLLGTLDYVAPEQLQGRGVDARTDVYALGCVVYEMLTGQVPYPRLDELQKLWAHAHDPPPSPRAAVGTLPQELDAVIARALAKSSHERYASAGELAHALTEAIGDAPPARRPPSVAPPVHDAAPTTRATPQLESTTTPLGAARRRRRWPVAGGLALLAVGAIATALALSGGGDEPVPGAPAGRVAQQVRPTPVSIGANAEPIELVAHGDELYVADYASGDVVKFDRASRRVVGRAQVGREPNGPLVVGRRLWAVSQRNSTVAQIDPRTMRTLRRFETPTKLAYVLPTGDTILTVIRRLGDDPEYAVQAIDARTRRVVGRQRGEPGYAHDVAGGRTPAVLSDYKGGTLTTYAPRLDRKRRVPIGVGGLNNPNVSAWTIGVALRGTTAWVTVNRARKADSRTLRGYVVRVDMRDGTRIGEPIQVGRRPLRIAVADGVAWVTNVEDETITRIDERTGQVIGKPIDAGPLVGPIAAVPGTGEAWASRRDDLLRLAPPR